MFQHGDTTQTAELTQAIASTLDDVEASVTTRRGVLVEEVILEEASQINANIIVVGMNQRSIWRQLLNRLLQNTPDVGAHLREHTTDDIEIMEIGADASVPQ